MVFKLNKEQYSLCKEYVLKVYEGKEPLKMNDEELTITPVSNESLDEFVDAADYAIIAYGMVNQDYLTPLGCELQWLYDEIYYQTCKD